jgi:ABC-2 type transport system permease protein
MISRGFRAVIKMHIKQQLLSRAFILSTFLMPVLMFGVIFLQAALANLNGPEKSHIVISSDDASLLSELETELNTKEEVQQGIYTLEFQQAAGTAVDDYLNSKRPLMLANSNNGLFYVPSSALTDKQVSFYSANINNQVLRQSMNQTFNLVLNRRHFNGLSVSPADLEFAVKYIDIKGFKVSAQGNTQGSNGNLLVGGLMALLLFMSMMGIVMPFSAAIIEEKTNRAVEVLLTSVSPQELLAGKILARAVTGLAQMLVWLIPLLVFVLFPAALALPPEFKIDIGVGTILFYLVNYLLGLTIFLSVWGGFSAMFDSTQDAGQAMWPISFLMMLPFYSVFAMISNPANSVAEILSMTPFTSLYVMPVRLAILEVPAWQPLLALALNALVCWLAIRAGGKIYRISVLATGQQPTMQQFIRWLRES